MPKTQGQIGYEAYAATPGRQDGRTMPSWDELPGNIVAAWEAAASAIANEHAKQIARACDDAEALPSTKRNA